MAEKSIFSRQISPFYQAGGVFIGTLALMLLFKTFEWSGISKPSGVLAWTMSGSGLLFYAILNSIMSLAYENQTLYWIKSLIAFAVLVIVGGLCSWAISGLSIQEAATFRWLYIVFTVVYIVFLTIVRLIKKIVQIAQKQDRALRGEE